MGSPRRPVAPADRAEQLAVDYSRFSTELQGSIAEQQGTNDEVAEEERLKILARFQDEGVSRSLSDRHGLRDLFAYLEQHSEVGFIVVNELERLTAGIHQRGEIVRLCKRLRITIVTEDIGRIDPFDEDKMQEADERAVRAAGEVLKIRRRTRRSLRQKVMAGTIAMRPAYGTRMKPLLGLDGEPLPSGMRVVDGNGRAMRSGVLETHPEELPWLRRIFAWAGEGASNDEICRRLMAAGVPSKTGKTQWNGNSIAGILANPLYKGEMSWGRQATRRDADGRKYLEMRDSSDPARLTMPSPLGALIDPALWEQVHELRAARSSERRSNRRSYGPQLFDDLVYCGRCGHKMYGRNDAAGSRDAHRNVIKWRYFCYSYRPGYSPKEGFGGCTSIHSLSEKKIFAALSYQPDDLPATFTVRHVGSGASQAQQRAVEKQIQDMENEHRQAVRVLLKQLISDEDFAVAKAARDTALRSARERLATLRAQTPVPPPAAAQRSRALVEMVDLLQDKSIPVADRRAALVRFGVRRIYIDNPRVQVELLNGYA